MTETSTPGVRIEYYGSIDEFSVNGKDLSYSLRVKGIGSCIDHLLKYNGKVNLEFGETVSEIQREALLRATGLNNMIIDITNKFQN
jgi:hypothetical protein